MASADAGWATRAHGYLIEMTVSYAPNPVEPGADHVPVYKARGVQIGCTGYGTTAAEAIVDMLRQHRDGPSITGGTR